MRYRFGLYVYGYVVMPEHVHLLLSEPQIPRFSAQNPGANPSAPLRAGSGPPTSHQSQPGAAGGKLLARRTTIVGGVWCIFFQ